MIVKTKMEKVYDTSNTTLKVEFGFGENWLEAH